MPFWSWILIFLTALGCFRESVRRLVLSPLDGLVWLAEQALATLARWSAMLRDAAARRLAENELHAGRWKATLALSALGQTAVFLAVAGTEFMLVALSMATLLGLDEVASVGGSEVELAMTGAVLLAGVYSLSAVVMLQEDAGGHLIVQHWVEPRARRLLRRLAWAGFALSALVVVGLATLRAHELVRADAEAVWVADGGNEVDLVEDPAAGSEPEEGVALRKVIQFAVLLASGLGLLLCAAVALELGVLSLLRLLPLMVTIAARMGVGVIRTVIGTIWVLGRALRALVRHVLDAVLAVATLVARIPAEAVRSLYRWATSADRSPTILRPIRAVVGVITSVALDLQLPVAPGDLR